MEGERKNTDRRRSKTFWGTIVKIKHLSLTSLVFMQLVPGDDRAIRHTCIRCIVDVASVQITFVVLSDVSENS